MGKKFFLDKIVSFKDNDVYVAVSLNFDIVAEGNDMTEALLHLRGATMGYLEVCVADKMEEKDILRYAPKNYQKMWNDSMEILGPIPANSPKGSITKKQNKIQEREVRICTESYIPSFA